MERAQTSIDRDLLDAVRKRAAEEGRGEEEVIEEAVNLYLRASSSEQQDGELRPWPLYPLFDSGDPTLAERVDEGLAGGSEGPAFGEH